VRLLISARSSLVSVDATATHSKYTADDGKEHYTLRLTQRKLFLLSSPPFLRRLEVSGCIIFGCGLTHLVFLGNFEFLSRPGGAKADAGPSE